MPLRRKKLAERMRNIPWAESVAALGVAAVIAPKVRIAQPFVIPVGQALVPPTGAALTLAGVVGFVVTKRPMFAGAAGAGLWAALRPWRLARQQHSGHTVDDGPHVTTSTLPTTSATFTVLSINVLYGRADATLVAHHAASLAADCVLIQECTAEFAEALESTEPTAKFLETYPYTFGQSAPRAAGTVTYSRHPGCQVGDWLADSAGDDDRFNPVVEIDTPAGLLTLSNIHTVPPAPQWASAWMRQLRRIGYHARQVDGPLIIAGDFNADLCHPQFRDLIPTFIDGVNGKNPNVWNWWRRMTWPRRSGVPFVRLDHILGRGLHLVDGGTLSIRGTDHHATWTKWTIPADQGTLDRSK